MNYLLLGKPNVGKSSIFNVLTEKNYNIIHKDAGTTRDWHQAYIKNTKSYIFDTPGILITNNEDLKKIAFFNFLNKKINNFIYVIEYKDGYNDIDNFSINQLRKFNKEIILVVNKFDNFNNDPLPIFNKYGIKKIIHISCSHRFGINKLNKVLEVSNSIKTIDSPEDYSVAIFGKPNAGKSTFLNSLVGYNRSLTSPESGTTSDYVLDYINYKGKKFKIIDTAGIGKKSNIKNNSINYFSIKKSFENIHKVDSAIIIIDSNNGIDRQDKRIIKLISNKSKSIVIVFNKLDTIDDKIKFKESIISDIDILLNEVKNIKIFFISALEKKNVTKVFEYLYSFVFLSENKISTSKLNQWLKKVVNENQHPMIDNKRVNFKYAVQIKSKPVTIKIFCSYSDRLKSNYKRYLINNFNYNFKILNQKTKIIFSSSLNPYI